MKKLILAAPFAAILCLAVAAFAGDAPNLVGTWKSSMIMHGENIGYMSNDTAATFTIKEQQGRVFHGVKTWKRNGKEFSETFSGVIEAGGKAFHLAEHDDGYVHGEILGADELALSYVETGDDAKAIAYDMKRVK